MIGLPKKNNITHPIYMWQKPLFDALEKARVSQDSLLHDKSLAVLKSRGIGGSEFLLRYMLWLCLKDNKMRGKQMVCITGIRENLAHELVSRYRNLLPNFEWEGREGTATINECRLIGYPSVRGPKDLRGLTDVSFILCDEFDHFNPSDAAQILPVIEALQTKSGNPTICLLSTPGPIDSVMHKLFNEPEDKCRYKRLTFPVQSAVGTLITKSEWERAKLQPNYEQEFELRFSSYGIGSISHLLTLIFVSSLGVSIATQITIQIIH
ncbi:MAG: hypothetical protein M3275_00070 [Thermoproteota archaeon]|nr:hypothetical protein [Thermoproteota archaeon]